MSSYESCGESESAVTVASDSSGRPRDPVGLGVVGRNRPAAPDAFWEAIDKAFELICTQPNIGTVATNVKLSGVRRILLSKVQHYLYYRVKSKPNAVEVVAIWHTSRYPDLML